MSLLENPETSIFLSDIETEYHILQTFCENDVWQEIQKNFVART